MFPILSGRLRPELDRTINGDIFPDRQKLTEFGQNDRMVCAKVVRCGGEQISYGAFLKFKKSGLIHIRIFPIFERRQAPTPLRVLPDRVLATAFELFSFTMFGFKSSIFEMKK